MTRAEQIERIIVFLDKWQQELVNLQHGGFAEEIRTMNRKLSQIKRQIYPESL